MHCPCSRVLRRSTHGAASPGDLVAPSAVRIATTPVYRPRSELNSRSSNRLSPTFRSHLGLKIDQPLLGDRNHAVFGIIQRRDQDHQPWMWVDAPRRASQYRMPEQGLRSACQDDHASVRASRMHDDVGGSASAEGAADSVWTASVASSCFCACESSVTHEEVDETPPASYAARTADRMTPDAVSSGARMPATRRQARIMLIWYFRPNTVNPRCPARCSSMILRRVLTSIDTSARIA